MKNLLSKKYWLLLVGAVALVVCIWILSNLISSERIEVTHPVYGPAVQAVYATGTVEATVTIPIAPRVTAKLLELYSDEGSKVQKGDVLGQFEDEDRQQILNELTAQEVYSRKEYERNIALVDRNIGSKEKLERSRADWDAAKAAVARAEAELDFLKLIAPADGLVIRRDGEMGQIIPANQAVFWLSCCAPLRVSTEVDEEDIALVQPGQKVLIRADAFPGKTYQGEVKSITPMGDPVARSYRVRINFMEETPLLIGMTAETNIIIHETSNALLVPSSSIRDSKLWLIKDDVLKQQEIQIGAAGPEQTEVISGIDLNDLVVITPLKNLEENQSISYKLVE